MRTKFLIIITTALLLGGAGCSWGKSGAATDSSVPIIPEAGVFGVVPNGWQAVSLKTFIKSADSISGFSLVPEAWQKGLGPKDEDGHSLAIKVRVLAIPKLKVSEYEANKDPANAARLFAAGDFVIYAAAQTADDVEATKLISSLKFVSK